MARLSPPDPATLPEPVRELLGRIPPLNLFRILAHAPTAVRPFVQLGNALLTRGTLDARLRELAILRVGHLAGADYEVHQHEQIARAHGLDAVRIAACAEGSAMPVFDARERAVLRLTEEVATGVRASAPTFAAVRDFLDDRQIAELVLTIGYYGMVARILEALEVEREAVDLLAGWTGGGT